MSVPGDYSPADLVGSRSINVGPRNRGGVRQLPRSRYLLDSDFQSRITISEPAAVI